MGELCVFMVGGLFCFSFLCYDCGRVVLVYDKNVTIFRLGMWLALWAIRSKVWYN